MRTDSFVLKSLIMKNMLLHLAVAIALSGVITFETTAQPVLDNTFSNDGYVLTKVKPSTTDVGRTVVVQSNGKILTGEIVLEIMAMVILLLPAIKPTEHWIIHLE